MIGLNRAMGYQPYSLDDKYNNMVGLNRSMGSQPYSLDDKYNNMVGLNRSMGSQPYPLLYSSSREKDWFPLTCLTPP
jgi:hypothetical protein